MKSILILGAGIMQLPAIKLARREGWRVYVADRDPQAPGCSLADRFLAVDLKDREGMAAAAADLKEKSGLDGVFTAGTDFSLTVAWVAKRLRLPGISPEAALRASNKGLMRQAFQHSGVPIPKFRELKGGEDPLTALEETKLSPGGQAGGQHGEPGNSPDGLPGGTPPGSPTGRRLLRNRERHSGRIHRRTGI